MLDKLFVAIAFAALVVFCGIVVVYVKEPDLTVTIVLILFIAGYDFWISVFRARGPVTVPDAQTGLEARPTAVSGRPLASPENDHGPS
jgi:hypothetical protein